LKEPVNKEYTLHGHLGPVTDTAVQLLESSGQAHSLPRENVKQIRLALQPSAPAGK
jgi:hypothetical protein